MNLLGGLLFSTIGLIAFGQGKRQSNVRRMWISAALMIYPYFIPNAILMFVLGIGLTAALLIFRE